MPVKLRHFGWEVGGEYLPWIWGQINYWDLERSHWRDVLRTCRQAGLNVLSTAVLPRLHQVSPGEYDFGRVSPQNDLSAFLTEAHELGLKVVLWAGPRNCPGVAASGYPDELLQDEAVLARDAKGDLVLSDRCFGNEVFTLPCLLSERLRQVLQSFADKLYQAAQSHVYPDGPIIGIGLTQAPGWAPALPAFAADYHPEAVASYQHFLKNLYSSLENVNRIYASNYSSFPEIFPPREHAGDFPDARMLDWARWREEYFVQAAGRLQGVFSKLTRDSIPIFIAAIPAADCPANLEELRKSRCFDFAMPEQPLCDGNQTALLRVIDQAGYLTRWNTRISQAQEDQTEEKFRLAQDVALGARGWDLVAPAGGGDFPGFISSRQGAPVRPRPELWEALREIAGTAGDFLASQIYGEVSLLTIPDMERSCYLQKPALPRLDLLDIPLSEDRVFQADDLTQAYVQTLSYLEEFLLKNQFPFLLANGQSSWDKLMRAKVMLVPGVSCMPAAFQAAVAQLYEKGSTIIIMGDMPKHPPNVSHPVLQELVKAKPQKTKQAKTKARSRDKSKPAAKGRLYHVPDKSGDKLFNLLKQIGIQRPVTIDHPEIRVFFHKYRNRIFVAAINASSETLETVVQREGKFVLKDFWLANRYWGGNNEIRIIFPPKKIKFWELIPC